ncbi:hypothetical protein M2419_002262 [Sphingobacterium sp. BIGb0116]|nr:hypothetical protein [Sphingobacterium sp. BIGb0116]
MKQGGSILASAFVFFDWSKRYFYLVKSGVHRNSDQEMLVIYSLG